MHPRLHTGMGALKNIIIINHSEIITSHLQVQLMSHPENNNNWH